MNTTHTWLGEISGGPEVKSDCQCTWDAQTVEVRADYDTLGVLVLYTRGVVGDWVDLVISDLSLDSLTGPRIHALERELGARVSALEIARTTYGRGHAEIPGSSEFTIIRLCNIGAKRIEC
jgi:hypothetical protein